MKRKKLTRKQFAEIKVILQEAFEDALRDNGYGDSLENLPEEWHHLTQKMFDLANDIISRVSINIEESMVNTKTDLLSNETF